MTGSQDSTPEAVRMCLEVRRIMISCSSGRSTTQVYGMPRDFAGDSRSNFAYHSLRMPSLMPLVRLPVQVARASISE